ncbi:MULTISPECIES: dihydropteroate synthase [unclassified Pedobacter]|uniref:dihydropteroate synthase n=1 Tax=unclassified Pedobacter TaxID=2628915 RepID=UPI001D30BAF7|nr:MULTISPECIES: dihydropteroate synthase [unclassified Pedobacter]CAH0296780.1 Dihydropteroate synthase [Pedobacter sp. Bi36]CAH0307435.1 Dihydropteroate synthase [Pedobacter sp. Bi126]
MAEKNFFEPKQSLNIKGKLIDLSRPKVMGILNITPDSFYSNSRTKSIDEALTKAAQFLNEGATFIDIGGYSSRPGAKDISTSEEVDRLVPVVESLVKTFPEAIISIDTFRAKVAAETISAGAHIINDIAAGDMDEQMFETVAKLQVPYMMMHMKGTPQNMQQNPVYDNVLLEVIDYLAKKVAALKALHVHDIIIDPGFGFGKTIGHNYELLNQLEAFKIFKLPILVGFSRKGMIYKTLGTSAAQALNGTSVLNTIALQKGVGILRVHDVREAAECVRLVEMLG